MSPGQVSKDGRLEETLYMENALMQQPNHIQTQSFSPNLIKAVHALVLVTSLTPDTGDPTSQASPSRAGTRCRVLMVGGHSSYKGHMS